MAQPQLHQSNNPTVANQKRELYRSLLFADPETMTDLDAEILYKLGQDPAIQSVLTGSQDL